MEILKTMKRTLRLLPFALVAFFVSCEKEANIPLPKADPKLVVTCFISPQDSVLKATVRLSRPVFQSSTATDIEAPVTDATVIMSNGSTSTQLFYDSNEEVYLADTSTLHIVAGGSYSIHVTTPDGKDVKAETVVPAAPPTLNYTLDKATRDSTSSGYTRDYHLEMSWNDITGQQDYYRAMVLDHFINQFNADTTYKYLGNDLITSGTDGTTLHSTLEWTNYWTSGGFVDSTINYRMRLLHVSKEYYQYHQALYNNNGGSDPFSEPTLMFTNINGGFGIFAGWNGSLFDFLP